MKINFIFVLVFVLLFSCESEPPKSDRHILDVRDAYKLGAKAGAALSRECAWEELERTAKIGKPFALPDDNRIVQCTEHKLIEFGLSIDSVQ